MRLKSLLPAIVFAFSVIMPAHAADQVPVFRIGRGAGEEFSELARLVSRSYPVVLSGWTKRDTPVMFIFDPRDRELPDELFENRVRGCSPDQWQGCCPRRGETIFKRTARGWVDTGQICRPEDGEDEIKVTPLDRNADAKAEASKLIARADLHVDREGDAILATRAANGLQRYIALRPAARVSQEEASPAAAGGELRFLACTFSVTACSTPSTTSKCQDRPGTPDRLWKMISCDNQPWKSVGDCNC
jgi:hypothetical protein